MSKMISVNKEHLILSRKYYNFSLNEVETKTKIKLDNLINFEEGSDFPSYSQLNKLSELYKRPLFFFFMQNNPLIDPITVACRSNEKFDANILSKQVKEMIEKAYIYRLNLEELNKEKEVVKFRTLLTNLEMSNEDIVHWLRDKLSLSLDKQKKFNKTSDLIEHIREHFFNIGVYIFKDSFKDNSVSGLCLFDETFPVILLNNKTTFNRQLFTIFHELYHLIIGKADIDYLDSNSERDCDVFASEFLIPKNDFDTRIKGIRHFENYEVISSLANEYTVSMDAIMYRLRQKGKISGAYYNKTREDNIRKMNSDTSGGNFYYTRMNYLGKLYLNNVFNSYYSGKISISEVGKYTNLKPIHVAKLASNIFGGGF